MTLYVPSDDEIRARAEQLGLLDTGAAVSALKPADRRRVARLISDEHRPVPATSGNRLLSRFTYEVPAGTIVVDVVLQPKKETP